MSFYQWSTTPSSNRTGVTDVDWASGTKLARTIDDTVIEMMSQVAEWAEDMACAKTTGGTADALTLTTNAGIQSLRDGIELGFIAGTAANAAATLNVDGKGAKALLHRDGTAIAAGEILSGGAYKVIYDASAASGSGAWVILNPDVGTGTVGLSSLANLDQYRAIGRVSSGAGVPEALTPDNMMTLLEQASNFAIGNWTPGVDASTPPSGLTYSEQVGRYVRIGNVVIASFIVNVSSTGSGGSGTTWITGLPVAALDTTYSEVRANGAIYGITTIAGDTKMLVESGTNNLAFNAWGGGVMHGSMTYHVA